MTTEATAAKVIINLESSPELAGTIAETAPDNSFRIQPVTGRANFEGIMQQPPAAILANANNLIFLLAAISKRGYPSPQVAVYTVDSLPNARLVCEREGLSFFELPEQLEQLGKFIGRVSGLSSKE